MQVVLRSDVDKVGKRGDIIDVADGFARNFLIPRGHAIKATKGIAEQAKAMRASRDKADVKNKEAAQATAAKLVDASLRIEARAGVEGKLFGSVTNHEIADAILEQLSIDVDRRQIDIHEHLKTLGDHQVPIRLHPDVQVSLAVVIVAAK